MVEISKSGSGEGLGGVIPRGYSKKTFCGWSCLARPSRLRRSHTAGMKAKVHLTYKLGSSVWSEVRAGLAAQSARLCVPAHRGAAGVRRDHADVLAILTPIWHDKQETARRVR